ncbi:hypothetical protein ACFLXT_03910 [Chloroflexota bacterium]
MGAAVAAVVTLDETQERVKEAHIVLGAVGATPIRAKEAEDSIIGEKVANRLKNNRRSGKDSDWRGTVSCRYQRVSGIQTADSGGNNKQALSQAIKRAREV